MLRSFYFVFFFLLFSPSFLPFSPLFFFFFLCLSLPPSAFCNHLFRAYKRILLCVVNVSSLAPCARNGERSKKGPGRNGGALCSEFVPRRSPCSFTRDDKSGVALTLHPSYHPSFPFPTDPPLLFSPTRKIIATALRITRSYLRPVRL